MKQFFVLRDAHLEAFGQAGLDRFMKKAARLLRRDHTVLAISYTDEALLNEVQNWAYTARSHELVTERQMYLCCRAGLILKSWRLELNKDRTVSAKLHDKGRDANQRAVDILNYSLEFDALQKSSSKD